MCSEMTGRVVTSRAGRDKGRSFAVIAPAGGEFVLIADGKTRKVARPKKKKLKHLVFEAHRLDLSRMSGDSRCADAFIRKALSDLGYNNKTVSKEGQLV